MRTVAASLVTESTEVTRRIRGGVTLGMHFHPSVASRQSVRRITSQLGW
jgi:hypothetical protein